MSEVLDDNLEKEENSNGFQLDFEEITPWNGANDTGKDVRMKWLRNFEKIRQNFELLSGLWSLKIDSDGKKYAYTNFPIVGAAGLTTFAGEEIKVDSIFKGLPIDTDTLQWVDGVLTVVGGTGGGEAGFVKWQNIEGKPSWITSEKPKYSYTEITGLTEELEKYVTLSTDQSVTGMKDFTDGMKVSGVLFKVINGVLTLDCSIAVTGGITTHAIGEQTTATIMDGIAVDGTTITKENGVLKVVGDIGGASNWDELEGKPSWITNTKPTYTWSEITQKPATLSGYGIQASDVLNTIKSVDGSGSGLDADTLDGLHINSPEYWFNGIAYVKNDGVMEIGRYLDFHYDSTDSSDHSTRLCISSKGNSNTVNLPTKTGTLALTTDNVASATKLQTARTIWGQLFDGTANVTGSLTYVTDITGTGTFTGANIKATDSVYVNGIRLHKTADGVITLEGNLAVTGGITQFAVNEVNPSTIMDGVVVDGTSIKKEKGVLKVMNAGGGEAGSVKWANITDKPITLAGYGVSASDVLSTLKTVDGSGSGLDADLLDGVHNGFVSGRLHTYSLPYTGSDKKNYWVKIATLKLTYQYTSQEAILLISEGYTLTSNSYYAFVSVRIQQQNSMGKIPNVSLKAFGSISNSDIVGILNYNSSSSTLDVYYREGIYQRGYVSYVQGAADIRTNSQELIATLPSGTQIISTNDCRCGYSDNADKLDGVQLNGIFTAFTTNGNNTRLTIGGVTKDLTVPYASNADKLDGRNYNDFIYKYNTSLGESSNIFDVPMNTYFSGLKMINSPVMGWFTGIVLAKNNNYLFKERIGINDGRLYTNYDNTNWKKIAFVDDNVASATKLETARKLWGNSFDGTKDITSSLEINGGITASAGISASSIELKFSTPFIDFHYNYSTKDYTSRIIEDAEGRLNINMAIYAKYNGNVGIGTSSPSQKLHINGNLLVTGGGTFYSSDIRAKTIIERPKLSLNSIANSPVIKFRWNGYSDLKDDGKLHIGGVAQYIEKILPECVVGQKDDFLSFDYATVGYVFSVLTARHLLSYETRTDRIIRKLKERIRRLERQLNIENHEEVCFVAD